MKREINFLAMLGRLPIRETHKIAATLDVGRQVLGVDRLIFLGLGPKQQIVSMAHAGSDDEPRPGEAAATRGITSLALCSRPLPGVAPPPGDDRIALRGALRHAKEGSDSFPPAYDDAVARLGAVDGVDTLVVAGGAAVGVLLACRDAGGGRPVDEAMLLQIAAILGAGIATSRQRKAEQVGDRFSDQLFCGEVVARNSHGAVQFTREAEQIATMQLSIDGSSLPGWPAAADSRGLLAQLVARTRSVSNPAASSTVIEEETDWGRFLVSVVPLRALDGAVGGTTGGTAGEVPDRLIRLGFQPRQIDLALQKALAIEASPQQKVISLLLTLGFSRSAIASELRVLKSTVTDQIRRLQNRQPLPAEPPRAQPLRQPRGVVPTRAAVSYAS